MNLKILQKLKISKPFERVHFLNLMAGFMNNRYIYLDIKDNRNYYLGKIIIKYNDNNLNLNNKIFDLVKQ